MKRLFSISVLVLLCIFIGSSFTKDSSLAIAHPKVDNTEKKLSLVYQDIKESFLINEDNYIKFELFEVFDGNNNEKVVKLLGEKLTNELCKSISDALDKYCRVGSTRPVILLNKNKAKFLMLFKDENSNNIKLTFSKLKDKDVFNLTDNTTVKGTDLEKIKENLE